jgi:hypothetical protein
MDGTRVLQEPPEQILDRIDAIIQELQALRQVVLAQTHPAEEDLATQLYGALGQGSWEEYDAQLDWQRFRS